MNLNKSKMESKTPIEKAIELHKDRLSDARDTLQNALEADNGEDSDGFIGRVQSCVSTLQYSLVQLKSVRDEYEFTLIAEHKMMKEALEEIKRLRQLFNPSFHVPIEQADEAFAAKRALDQVEETLNKLGL